MGEEHLVRVIEDFNPRNLNLFFRSRCENYAEDTEGLNLYDDDRFNEFQKLGEIRFDTGEKLIVVSSLVKDDLTERSGKKAQYEKAKNILKDQQIYDAGFFIFHDDSGSLRFSLIYAQFQGVKRTFNNFRRFTYFVSKDQTNKTFLKRVGECNYFSLETIKDAFSVEKVNKEFYGHIARFFYRLIGYNHPREMKLPSVSDGDKKTYQEFAVRLIGRAIFCWFLKHKRSPNGESLIPESILSSKAVRQNSQYYHSVLEKLFFEVLNTQIKERKGDIFDNADKIPFLNGGLFEPHKDDFNEPSLINALKIPDEWFEQFFEILEQYNFTIDENSTIDADVSVDPEMLGRIFENLLAEVNPETGESARKATGSYYTPRTIVDHMVDQSLKQYLMTKTNISEDKITGLLSYEVEDASLTDTEKDSVIAALDEVKIIDPACGSGAFPMGILHKMLLVLQKVDPHLNIWLRNHLGSIEPGVFRDKLLERIKNENWEYVRKLLIIQNSIYGVDIQTIAVEISKLRFFLSLIVDEKIEDTKENRGVEALPNLEFKFVAANTLIGLPPVINRQVGLGVGKETDRLKELRDRYLRSYGREKKEIEEDFLQTRGKLIEQNIDWGGKDALALQLANWDPFSNEACEWFDPEWMFGTENGFDIVIANPPYVEHKKLKALSGRLKNNYSTYSGTADLYVYFYEQGLNLLRTGCVLTFISSNKFIKTSYGKKLRQLLSSFAIYQIIDFTKVHVFDALVASCIVIVTKNRPNKAITVTDVDDSMTNQASLADYVKENYREIGTQNLGSEIWQFEDDKKLQIKMKLERNSKTFSEIDGIHIYRGVTTGYNPAFIIDESVKNSLIKADKNNSEVIKPLLQGRNIKKWTYIPANYYLIFTRQGITMSRYPIIQKYLRTYYEDLKPRKEKDERGRKPGSYKWFEIQDNTAYYKEFEKEKIIWGLTADKWAFAYDAQGHYLPSNGYILTSSGTLSVKYILALLNSKLLKFYFSFIGIMTAGGAYTLKHETISAFPFKEIYSSLQQPFNILVDYILNITQDNSYLSSPNKQGKVKEYEHQIDQLVYELYGLTPEEIAVMEGFKG